MTFTYTIYLSILHKNGTNIKGFISYVLIISTKAEKDTPFVTVTQSPLLISDLSWPDSIRKCLSSCPTKLITVPLLLKNVWYIAVADPGFPKGSCITHRWARKPIIWHFLLNTTWKWKKLDRVGIVPISPPLDPPLYRDRNSHIG